MKSKIGLIYFGMLSFFNPVYASVALNNELILQYKMNGDANDSSLLGNHGTVNGAMLTKDRLLYENRAYSFDGNSGITLSDNPSLNNMTELTISAWIKLSPNTSSYQTIVNKGVNNYLLRVDHNSHIGSGVFIVASINNNYTLKTDADSIELDKWQHVAFTWKGSSPNEAIVYINGVVANTQVIQDRGGVQTAIQASTTPLTVGQWTTGDFFRGDIDNVRIYRRSLLPAEIIDIYNEDDSDTCGGLVTDRDNDGVLDQWDNCPNTLFGSFVNADGCSTQQLSYQEGRQSCIDDPSSCGIVVNGNYTQNDLEAARVEGYNEGISACPTN